MRFRASPVMSEWEVVTGNLSHPVGKMRTGRRGVPESRRYRDDNADPEFLNLRLTSRRGPGSIGNWVL